MLEGYEELRGLDPGVAIYEFARGSRGNHRGAISHFGSCFDQLLLIM